MGSQNVWKMIAQTINHSRYSPDRNSFIIDSGHDSLSNSVDSVLASSKIINFEDYCYMVMDAWDSIETFSLK